MMKISYIITIQLMLCLLNFKWKMQGQIKDKKHPVKLPMKPINMVKWGTTTANKMVTTTTPTLNPRPQTLSSPSRDQILGKGVSGFPLKNSFSRSSQTAQYGRGQDRRALTTKIRFTMVLRPSGRLLTTSSDVSVENC